MASSMAGGADGGVRRQSRMAFTANPRAVMVLCLPDHAGKVLEEGNAVERYCASATGALHSLLESFKGQLNQARVHAEAPSLGSRAPRILLHCLQKPYLQSAGQRREPGAFGKRGPLDSPMPKF
jgi:hypothetical protein